MIPMLSNSGRRLLDRREFLQHAGGGFAGIALASLLLNKDKAPGAVARLAREASVRCVVFGGRVVEPVAGADTVALSGDPSRARADLVALGRALRQLLDPPLGGV